MDPIYVNARYILALAIKQPNSLLPNLYLMKKQLLLILLLSFITLQSYNANWSIPASEIETNAVYLSNKLNINSKAVQLALTGYAKLKEQGRLVNQRFLTIADFSKPSSEERFYIIDMELQEMVMQTFVAHGKNSGKLFARFFSNTSSSNKSSLGFYITGTTYSGKHGRSLRLTGVEQGINDKADQRAIVLHGAAYVSNNAIAEMGYLGRSLGCPAVPEKQVYDIIQTIQGESCLFIYAPDKQYLSKSQLIG